jgi:hypothetical protein
MPDILKTRVMLHGLLHAHHGMLFWLWCASIVSLSAFLIIIVIIPTAFICEILRALVLVGAAIVLEASHYLIDVGRRVLV